MEERKWKESIIGAVGQRNIFVILCLGLVIANILQGVLLFGKKEKIVLIPAGFKQSFWAQGEYISDSYLEEMSFFVSNLLLNATPQSHKYRSEVILRYIVPEYYHDMEKKLLEEGERMARDGVSTTFTPQGVATNAADLKAVVTGSLTTYVSGERIGQRKVRYEIHFGYTAGIIMVKNFKVQEG